MHACARFVLRAAPFWLLLSAQTAAAQTCRQALVLALDVSLSVNTLDFALQRQGLANALLDAQVMDAIISPDGPHVELAVFEWSGSFSQNLLVDWTVIDSPATLQAISATLIDAPQTLRSGRTGLGAALEHARDMLLTRAHCAVLTMDISGDGQNNSGIAPQLVKDQIADLGITINALVIEPDGPTLPVEDAEPIPLSVYFHRRVIAGPAAFVETIVGFGSYGDAMKRKLLRELMPAVSYYDTPSRMPDPGTVFRTKNG